MERHQQSPRIPESVWKVHEDTIQRVYMTEKQNLETLMEGMAAIHNFDASKKQYRGIFQKWGFNKNNLLNDIPGNDRRRAAQALPKRLVQEPFLIVICCQPSPPEFRWSTEEERQLWRIKVATDTIIKGSFGSTSCKWTLDNFSFFASPIGLSLSYEWQSLESLCTAIADMSGSGVQSHGRGSIELLLQRTEGLKETLSPEYFVVQLAYIWRICLNLTKTRLPLPRYTIPDSQHPISIHPLAPSFLYRLDQQMQTNFREGDPARQVISSLLVILRISPHRFKSALKLAYRMSIKVLRIH
ncbi:uncharacterized protein FPOAC1_014068 [Fusarium poae]|uniref:uncharacterized protein n=1 Tax=Fusarium poae TaxID=36050 RepID=UPI001D03FB44|nr:uncharacterized protein FPOAC1_014068 [Fusarium poae]KAG8664099.1 hypothetical protein FPOAC1_014068 [Fusarium poae]